MSFTNVIKAVVDNTSKNNTSLSPQFAGHAPFSTSPEGSDLDSTHVQLLKNVEVWKENRPTTSIEYTVPKQKKTVYS